MRRSTLVLARLAPVALVAALSGCAIGPEYRRPDAVVPGSFRGSDPTDASLADLAWWEVYEDPVLQGLIREALANNTDLAIAAARIEQARAIAAQSRAALYPSVGYSGAASVGRNEFLGGPAYNIGDTQGALGGFLSAAWEFDLWGRLRNLNQADLEDVIAVEAVADGVRLSVVSETAQLYLEILELDRRLAISYEATTTFQETVRIFTLRRDGGTASNLEVARAEAALFNASSETPKVELATALAENALSTLLGRAPGPIQRGQTLLEQRVPPTVPSGLPAQLLERRPDLLEVEARLRAANARIGATEALKLPQIGLSSFLGQVSPDLEDISSAGLAWSVAATIAGPIFDAGLTDAQIAQAKAIWAEAVAEYDRRVLVSLREVADALVSRQRLAELRVLQQKTVAAYAESVEVAMKRYLAGKSSYYEVLEAQQSLYPAQNALARTQREELTAIVRLYRALGGGWNLPADRWAAASSSER